MKTIDTLTNIFRKPDYESKLLLGEALLKDKVITVSQLQKALDIQRLNQKNSARSSLTRAMLTNRILSKPLKNIMTSGCHPFRKIL